MTSIREKYKNLFTKDEISEIVRKKIGSNAFKINRYEMKPASEDPLGFLGDHILLMVNINDNLELRFFVKKLPSGEVPEHLKYAQETKAFYKEVELYTTLFDDFKNAQNRVDSKWRPEFYYSRGTEMIVVEDLTLLGYKIVPERTLLDEEHIRATLKTLAKMHAASIIFEEKFNEKKIGTKAAAYVPKDSCKATIQDIYPHLIFESEATDIEGHIGNTFCEAGIRSEVILIDLLEGYSEDEVKIIKIKLQEQMRKLFKLSKPSTKYKNIILHADLWTNNIMFRYDETGKVKQALLVDFQMVRYAPPAHDIMLLLYLTQTRSFRQEHQEELIRYYYKAFSTELRLYDLSSDKNYPWDTFKESCDFYEELGAVTNVHSYQLILLPSNIIGKYLSSPELYHQTMFVDRREMVKECFLTDEVTRERTTEALHELIDRFILKKT